jgi:hypothetical protein
MKGELHISAREATACTYLPDDSNLYLFPTVKEKLERIHLADEDQFFECLRGAVKGLDQQELNRVFQAWVGRVQAVSEDNGGYVG